MKITDGSVYATGNATSAIGHGKSSSNDGSLEIIYDDGTKVTAGASKNSASPVEETSGTTARVNACRNYVYAAITPCTPHSFTKYPADKITGTTHTSVCAYCGTEGTTARHVYENDGFCVCGKQGTNYTAAVATAPEAKALTYNGAAQELVEAGTATNGTMQYTLGTETAPGTDWSTSIPTGTAAETYHVWYKAQGDANFLDSEPLRVQASIAKAAVTDIRFPVIL